MVGYTSVTVTTGGKLSVAMDSTTMKPQSSVVAWALAHQVRPDLLPLLLIIILFVDFTIYPVTQYGQGTQDIYAKNLNCTTSGSESYLTDCPASDSCCGHHKDVGLACQPACSPGQIRLVGGPNAMEGRVEVCNEGRWGTVCDDLWGVEDARVACKQAGFPWRGESPMCS